MIFNKISKKSILFCIYALFFIRFPVTAFETYGCNEIREGSKSELDTPDHDNFIVITPEKSGTLLILKTLSNLLNKDWRMYWKRNIKNTDLIELLSDSQNENYIQQFHLFYHKKTIARLKSLGYKIIFLLRDPRDQLISTLFFIRNSKWWGLPGGAAVRDKFLKLNFDDQITELITGKKFGVCLPDFIFSSRFQFLNQNPNFVFVSYFENLVGKEGGGDGEQKIKEVLDIKKFLNVDLSDNEVIERTNDSYGRPGEGNFRKGTVGQWREHFNKTHKDHFKKIFGKKLIELGYESDLNW